MYYYIASSAPMCLMHGHASDQSPLTISAIDSNKIKSATVWLLASLAVANIHFFPGRLVRAANYDNSRAVIANAEY